ncbi:ferredoxin [Alginatibacterium sediminis]|uniref:Ferredoxin n=1 Tax=Alginatibacterium sediminis TaxID=2164068 RepID=A0A420EBV6_9ALTE|nr:class I ribonucleotide reductase maintenance protein YfaE [Alginatibacterium sediminis]RKF18122.1 ferredoxin [Alginatibacterium sediminis]
MSNSFNNRGLAEGRVLSEGVEVVVDGSQTILEAFEQSGFAPEYHCREGVCGACRCSLVSGDVKYQATPLAFVPEGDVLICQARPVGKIELAKLPPLKQHIA